jgi:hypothetical protein
MQLTRRLRERVRFYRPPAPAVVRGRTYPALALWREILKMIEATYRERYRKILDNLDPRQVYEDLGENSIIICWEAPGKFSHRRLVAEWLEDHLEVTVPEVRGTSLCEDL